MEDRRRMGDQNNSLRIGVIADTHVPDRARALHPDLIPGLAAHGVSQILHAGDVCIPGIVAELEQVAPVAAVGGNRDHWFRHRLVPELTLEVDGVQLALVHGHGGFLPYFIDKWQHWLEGYRQARYLDRLHKAAPGAKVVVFGHTHRPVNLWRGGQLFFNPGSASVGPHHNAQPSYGILYITQNGSVHGEVIELNGVRLVKRMWVPAAKRKS
jgi:putative phosphoesterase